MFTRFVFSKEKESSLILMLETSMPSILVSIYLKNGENVQRNEIFKAWL